MALQKHKCDPALGARVFEHLKQKGLRTPVVEEALFQHEGSKIDKIEALQTQVLELLGLDLSDDSLIETPRRIAKMYVSELFWGLHPDHFPKCTTVENKMRYDEVVIEKASVKSVCEHHFVYFGTSHRPDLGCWIAYVPKEKVLGLSKINRIVEYFARRPQIQERLTEQIAETLKFILETDDVAVVMKGQHFCVLTRGVEDSDGMTITSALHGRFRDELPMRQELMSLVR